MMLGSLVLGSLLIAAGTGFIFFAIGIGIGNMQVRHLIKHGRSSDFMHIAVFFSVGLALDLLGNAITKAPLRSIMMPLVLLASSIALYFGHRTGKIY
jgi:hypothetical protein